MFFFVFMANMTFACHSIVPLGLNHSRSYCFSGTRSSLRTELDCGWEGERALYSTLGSLQQLQQQLRGGKWHMVGVLEIGTSPCRERRVRRTPRIWIGKPMIMYVSR